MHYAVGLIENGRSEKKQWGPVHYEGAWANSKADLTVLQGHNTVELIHGECVWSKCIALLLDGKQGVLFWESN